MSDLPQCMGSSYRPATGLEIRSWSFGAVSAVRGRYGRDWRRQRGTLDDQRIFGPSIDFHCACGQYRGPEHNGTVCQICGVKVTSASTRRSRLGHINLPSPLPHPLGTIQERIDAVPIIPAGFWNTAGGSLLPPLYERIVLAIGMGQPKLVERYFRRVVAILVPIAAGAYAWGLQDAHIFVQGLALARACDLEQELCEICGYPLAGLRTAYCPMCGSRTVEQ